MDAPAIVGIITGSVVTTIAVLQFAGRGIGYYIKSEILNGKYVKEPTCQERRQAIDAEMQRMWERIGKLTDLNWPHSEDARRLMGGD
jgi:hypothetical protein